MKDLQQYAADVGTLCDIVVELGELLDKIHARHGEELYADVQRAFPLECEFGGDAHKKLLELYRRVTP